MVRTLTYKSIELAKELEVAMIHFDKLYKVQLRE